MIVPSMTACGSCTKDQVVFAGAGLAFIAVDQDILGLRRLLRHERPLHAGREASAAAAAQVGGLHLGDDAIRAHAQWPSGSLVAVELDVFVDVGRALAKAEGDDIDFIGMGDELGHYFSALPRALLAIFVQYRPCDSGRQVLVEVVIDLDRRRPAAGSDALDLFEREHAVGRGLPCGRCRALLAVVEKLVAAAQHAADVGADLHVDICRAAWCAAASSS